ncbi:2-keto-4-pentenoate hydratase [Piscinibacter koreensis]|uniref:2-keto-4-pentenoate hydratase n=1 Tax=Piscinibacter koreensis TaxID=2742824 RepID=A0A7Y6NKQ2_9BURK|nr:2-keto-4-pentenoate hydratase [Schlegelella koreensis]NUZ05005.1 2-keto-4-pentenoate hydratase [Schlegelella koreensis]
MNINRDLNDAARALASARRATRPLDALPQAWQPRDLDAAYRLQRAVADQLGAVRGWKVGVLAPAVQAETGIGTAVAGPLLEPWFAGSPASWRRHAFSTPIVECEFAFELGADLPPRDGGYSREEVDAAVGTLRVVIELVDRRIPRGSGVLAEIADAFNNGGFVVGPAVDDWRGIDFANHAVVLRASDATGTRELAHGTGRATLGGDPLGALVLLANAQPPGYGGLKRGQIVTTGSCALADALPHAASYEADFGTLGRVTMNLT